MTSAIHRRHLGVNISHQLLASGERMRLVEDYPRRLMSEPDTPCPDSIAKRQYRLKIRLHSGLAVEDPRERA